MFTSRKKDEQHPQKNLSLMSNTRKVTLIWEVRKVLRRENRMTVGIWNEWLKGDSGLDLRDCIFGI